MSSQCKVCSHPKRLEIERDILSGRLTNTDASKIVGCSETSIRRHFKNHVSKAVQELKIEQPKSGVLDAFSILENTINDCRDIMEAAKGKKDFNLQLKAMAQMIDNLTLASRLFELNKKEDDSKLTIEVVFHDAEPV
ncbi:MAG: hypothetical protein KA886_11060 [Candidatus Cloacimonetes bacterium]|nr:hypothetical protein [Candidatus Cloacimonadota bacterium]